MIYSFVVNDLTAGNYPVWIETVSSVYPPKALSTQLEFSGIIKDAVKCAEQRGFFLEILSPECRLLIADKDHVEITFFVMPLVN